MAETAEPGAQEAALRALLDGYTATTHTNYIGTGGFALVVYDYFYTLPDEIRFIWPTALSVPKVLFFILRYYVFVNNIFAVLYNIPKNLSPEECQKSFMRSAYSTPVLTLGAEAILFIRAYAFGGRSRAMLLYLIIQYLALHTTAFILLVKFVRSAKFIQLPFHNMSCMPVQASSNYLGGVFTLLLGGVFIVMFLMIFIALRKHRDGIFYFIILGTLLSANIFVTFVAPEGYKLLFIQFTVDMHSVLSARMLLHLREWAERDQYGSVLGTHAYTLTNFEADRDESSQGTIANWNQVVGRMRGSRGSRGRGVMRMLMNDGLEWSTSQTKTAPSPVELLQRRNAGDGSSAQVRTKSSRVSQDKDRTHGYGEVLGKKTWAWRRRMESAARENMGGHEPDVTEIQRTSPNNG